MERKFRESGSRKIWKYKDAGSIYNDYDGIHRIKWDNEIVLRRGFKPVKRSTGYIDIVKEE